MFTRNKDNNQEVIDKFIFLYKKQYYTNNKYLLSIFEKKLNY